MKTLIRLFLLEQSDLGGLHCLPRPICLETLDHYVSLGGYFSDNCMIIFVNSP